MTFPSLCGLYYSQLQGDYEDDSSEWAYSLVQAKNHGANLRHFTSQRFTSGRGEGFTVSEAEKSAHKI
jgi:hypothetical protein